ncbi:MAG TPA: glycosyltransferase family 4 protein [Polyangia bacterium]|jgi:glycosyltransferase involved in cell wall biosynthesis
MQRVLVIAFSVVPSPGRHSVQLVNHLKALAPRYAVDVVTVKSPDLPYVDRFMKTRMLRVPCTSGPLSEQVEAFRRAVRRQLDGVDYDVVHFRCPWGGRPVCEAKGELGTRTIFEVARSPEGEPKGIDPALAATLRRDEAFCLEAADRVIVPTEAAGAFLRRRGLGTKVSVVAPGVDIDLFDWEEAAEPDPPRVLLAGRLGPARGVRLMLEAAREIVQHRAIELWLAGPVDPGFEEALDQATERLGLQSVVRRLGPVEHGDLPRVISSATVCVAPHAADEHDRPLSSYPTKVLEYLACRRPVVAPRRAAVAELMKEGQEGLMFTPGDVRDLAAKVLVLLGDPELRARLAEAGYRAARERHPASAARRALLEVYARLAPPEMWGPCPTGPVPSTEIPAATDTTTARHAPLRDSTQRRMPPPDPGRPHAEPPVESTRPDLPALPEEPDRHS